MGREMNTPEIEPDYVMWTSAGRKYHIGKCRGFWAFQQSELWGLDTGTPFMAATMGKFPCLVCKPPVAFDPPFDRTYGHHPVSTILDGRGVGLACARCEVRVPPVRWPCTTATVTPVRWPCTTATVLGLR